MISLTRDIGESFLSLNSKVSGGIVISSYYVRPLGATYGTGDGSSYENAWSGFSAIDWQQLGSHTRLYVCGTHNEFLDWQVANTIIQGNYPEDPGVIDGQDILNRCFRLVGYNNVTINHLSFLNGVVDCAYTRAIGIVYNHCTGSGSGNQAFQNEGESYHVTYNNCVATDNVDDGISLHGGGTVIANDCTFYNNGQGVHGINTGTFMANRCIFYNNGIRGVEAWEDASFTINDSFFFASRGFSTRSSIPLIINGCFFFDADSIVDSEGTCEVRDSSFTGSSTTRNSGSLTLERCFINSSTNTSLRTIEAGNMDVRYCIFKMNTGKNDYAIQTKGTGYSNFLNCTIVGIGGFGRAIQCDNLVNFTNCILNGLNLAFNPNGENAVLNADHCNVFNCASKNVNQNGGVFNETNPIVGDPLLTDIANNNYSIQAGSSCIDAGIDTGFPEGIDTANWGDSENTPVVSTKLQGENYDIGAYVK